MAETPKTRIGVIWPQYSNMDIVGICPEEGKSLRREDDAKVL